MADDQEIDGVFFDPEPDRELSRLFKADPTIENYLKLRAENPDREIEVGVTGGLDWLLANDQLLIENDIQPRWVAGALDADHDSISRISLALLQKLADRKQLITQGKTHLASRGEAISDSFANYLIAIMLDSLSWNNDLQIPRDLIVLTRYQLFGTEYPAMEKRWRSYELEKRILWLAVGILETGQGFTAREIAKALKINVSTISRLYPGDSLVKTASEQLDAIMSLREFSKKFKAKKQLK